MLLLSGISSSSSSSGDMEEVWQQTCTPQLFLVNILRPMADPKTANTSMKMMYTPICQMYVTR